MDGVPSLHQKRLGAAISFSAPNLCTTAVTSGFSTLAAASAIPHVVPADARINLPRNAGSRWRVVRVTHRLKMFLFYRAVHVLGVGCQGAGDRLLTPAGNRIEPCKLLMWLGRLALCSVLFVFLVTYNLPWETQHIAVVSTTYFPVSKSYEPNSIVVLFNAQNGFWPPWPLMCRSRNATGERRAIARVRYAFTPIFICQWTVFLATCPVVANPIEFALTDVRLGSQSVLIPYRTTSYDRRNQVVACFSPLFYNERWQLIILTLELYRQMGVSLQVYYVQSMLIEILQFLQAYEKQKITRVKTWTSMNVGAADEEKLGYDPNTELEWRNQASAHTDCLLKYKEVAEFIIVSDIDDVLIPRLGTSFLDEFRSLGNQFPGAAGFSYNRYNTQLMTSRSSGDFALEALLNGARIANEWEDPKYVVRPERVQTVWLHWPGIIDDGEMVTVAEDANIMLHFRNWTMTDLHADKQSTAKRKSFDLFRFQVTRYVTPALAARVERGFREFLASNTHARKLYEQLPRNVHYYPIIADCYNRIFYARGRHPVNCPGPIRCVMPPIAGLRCAMARRATKHRTINDYIRVHYAGAAGEFIVSHMGCKM